MRSVLEVTFFKTSASNLLTVPSNLISDINNFDFFAQGESVQ